MSSSEEELSAFSASFLYMLLQFYMHLYILIYFQDIATVAVYKYAYK